MTFAYLHAGMKINGMQILILLSFTANIYGQSLQSLVSTTGNSLTNNSLALDYSIGEIAINTMSSSSYFATIGFLQPFAFIKPPEPVADAPIVVYQFLSPNQDSDNETFQISGLPALLENEVLIFDRNGKKVFSAVNYGNDWDGGNLPEGNYFYVVKIPARKMELKGGLVIAK